MLKGDVVSCRLQYGDEAMVKKGKAILKQTGAGIFVYSVLGLLGAFDSYYRDNDAGTMVQLIAEYVGERLIRYMEITN